MICVGSVTRDVAAKTFSFLAEKFAGRRNAIKDLTHGAPEFVFWIFPNGKLHDAKDAHLRNVPRGYEHIVHDEPEYGGFLRGRVVRLLEKQLIVVYCAEEALSKRKEKVIQFVAGMAAMPIPLDDDALVISDNGDIFGSLEDVRLRALES